MPTLPLDLSGPDSFSGVVSKALWKDLAPVPWVQVTVATTCQTSSTDMILDILVTSQDHEITHSLFRGRRVRIPGAQVRAQVPIPDFFRAPAPGQSQAAVVGEAVIKAALAAVSQDLAPSLREQDPRVGRQIEMGARLRDVLPACPLFDPPRLCAPEWEAAPPLDSVPCPICHEKFGRGAPAMWGGGNLLWVHPGCWLGAWG